MATSSSNEDHSRGHGGQESGHRDHSGDGAMQKKMQLKMYLRFAAMIATSMVVMYWTMFAGTWEWSHVQFSESRVFMALTMGGTMGLVMLGWMLNMYKNVTGNIAIVAVSLLLLGGGIALDRSQVTVDDIGWMKAMIPHHSLAITRSERADIDDVRVCQLAVEIIRAQEREIADGVADRRHRGERGGRDRRGGQRPAGSGVRGLGAARLPDRLTCNGHRSGR